MSCPESASKSQPPKSDCIKAGKAQWVGVKASLCEQSVNADGSPHPKSNLMLQDKEDGL